MTVTHDGTDPPTGDDPCLEEAQASPAPEADSAALDAESGAPEADATPSGEEETAVEAEGEAEVEYEEDDEEPFVISPYDQPGRWFVVHTYAVLIPRIG